MTDFDLQMAAAKLAEALLPDDEVRQQKANATVISRDGGVHSRALAASLPWYRVDVSIPGAAVAGSSVRRVPFPQGGRLRHISLYARTAPTSEYTIGVTAGGESQYFSLQAGASTAMRSTNLAVNPGSWVIIDVMNAGGAADVEITLQYSVLAGGSSSAGSGGSSSGGGGTAIWGEIGGTLLHQTDLSSALAGKASVSHDHDGTYSPATHTHAYSDLTGKPTLGTAAAMASTAFATAAQGAKADTAVQPADLAAYSPATHSHSWTQITGKPTTFAPATHTHAYSDLTGKPAIPTTLAALDTTVTGAQLNALKTKVDGIASGATANATNAQLRDRATHTGAQAISTVTGLQTALDGKAATNHTHATADVSGLDTALSGKASTSHTHGVSDLTATGTRNSTTILYGDNTWKTAPSGGGGVTDHTALTNIGTNTHAQIDTHIANTSNPHGVTAAQVGAPTTATLTAHTGNTSNPHSVTAAQVGAPTTTTFNSHTGATAAHGATGAVVGTTNTQTLSNKTLASPAITGTPTGITKAHVGLANVDNTSDLAKPISTATQTALNLKADTTAVYTQAEVDALIASLLPQTKRGDAGGSFAGSSVGTTYVRDHPDVTLTFTGLNPARQYEIFATVGILSQGTTQRNFRTVFQAVGATTVVSHALASAVTLNNQLVTDTSGVSVYPTAGGEIVIRPAFTLTYGTVTAVGFSITATVT